MRDRVSGAVWRNQHAATQVWTASTIKLGVAVDILARAHAGQVRLTPVDHAMLRAMLRRSDDAAANMLWDRFGGADIAARFPRYGLHGASFGASRRWGSMKCSADALDGLLRYVLERLAEPARAYLVAELRAVVASQRWGVWGAGPAAQPGAINGWWEYGSGWVINSAGFLGADERHTLVIMNDLRHRGAYADGVQTTTRIAELLFAGDA